MPTLEHDDSKRRLLDFVSGLEIPETPEELRATQPFSRQLIQDYSYPKSHIQTRPQWRVKARPSDKKKEYPVDIAVFTGSSHTDDNIYIVIECKSPTRSDGQTQLQDYLRFSKASLGVWYNGQERLFLRKIEKDGHIHFPEIPNLPRYMEPLEATWQLRRASLKPTHNLKYVFSAMRNHLAANAKGTTRDEEFAEQLIYLVLCKIYDERFTAPGDIVDFRIGIDEPHQAVAARIQALFQKVKAKYSEVLSNADYIELHPPAIAYIVGEMQYFEITATERDVVADAFEVFIGNALKGAQGQFFTPRNVVRLLTTLVNPSEKELVLDPACGSGGFLIESLKLQWYKVNEQAKKLNWTSSALFEEKMATAINNIRGIEKDKLLCKVAKAYMAITGDGKAGIFEEDSLDLPTSWDTATKQKIHLGMFDVVLTNPPFGKELLVKGKEKLYQYQLAHQWKNSSDGIPSPTDKLLAEQKSDVLFIERCLQFLRNGGRLGIVLPETYFHAPRSRYIREFFSKHNIQWIVDLPHNTFRPHNNAKCLMIVLEKNATQQPLIHMAVAEEMGHDHHGKPMYRYNPSIGRRDSSMVWDDIELILNEVEGGSEKKYTFNVSYKEARDKDNFVPRSYWNIRDQEIIDEAEEQGYDLLELGELIKEKAVLSFDGHGSPEAEFKGMGDYSYIRVKDIVNWDVYKDPTSSVPESEYNKLTNYGKNKTLKVGDVLFVRRGSYRIGSVAIVSEFDIDVILTREITVFRVLKNKYNIDAYYFLYAMSHKLVQDQLPRRILVETTLPNIADRWKTIRLPIPKDPLKTMNISTRVRAIIESKWSALKDLAELRVDLGSLVT